MLSLKSIMNRFLILFAVVSLFLFTQTAEAKVLPQAVKSSGAVIKNSGNTGINVSPKLRADRRALTIYFSNLQNASAVSYTLTYDTNEQQEGAIGSLALGKSSNASQELLFGTCSKNVCRYHSGISNMRLEVSYTSKLGKKYIKRYKIKV